MPTVRMSACVMALAFTFAVPSAAHAVTAALGDSSTIIKNTFQPLDGSPWDNVIELNGASGIYLGGGWILGADHVGFDTEVNIAGLALKSTNQAHRLDVHNEDGTDADLLLYRLDYAPANDDYFKLEIGKLEEQSRVVMIGNGGGEKAWATNEIEDIPGSATNAKVAVQSRQTWSVFTDFDLDTPNQGQGIGGDSGGAVFFQGDDGWKLGGVMFAVTTLTAPQRTYIVDLHAYADQINSFRSTWGDAPSITLVPEPGTVPLLLVGAFWTLRRRGRNDDGPSRLKAA